MFYVNDDLSIYATRGDIVFFSVTAEESGVNYKFQPGDVVRMKVYGKKDAKTVVLQKDFPVTAECESVEVLLTEDDTKIGDVISKPVDYWYEIELNPFSAPQTIIGYDEDGAKIFRIYPEGKDLMSDPIKEEDIPVVDDDFSLTSERPLQNQAITRELVTLKAMIEQLTGLSSDDIMAREELLDIRIGADGTIYDTAGDAVREQFDAIRTEIGDMNTLLDDINGEVI